MTSHTPVAADVPPSAPAPAPALTSADAAPWLADLWAFVLRHAPAGRTASATLAIPALAVAISWLLLEEVPALRAMVGGVIALLGVIISRRRPGR